MNKEIIEKINNIIDHYRNTEIIKLDGDFLSQTAVKLAAYKVNLGEFIGKVEPQLNSKEMERKSKWSDLYAEARQSEEKRTVDDCKAIADKQVRKLVSAEINLKNDLILVKNLRQDVGDLISTIQSRLSYLKQERQDVVI